MATKYTAAEVIEAIRGSRGLIANVARKLGVSRMTVYRYIERWTTVAAALEEERENLIDDVEDKLLQAIARLDVTAIKYFLSTVGHKRGWVERKAITQQVEHRGTFVMEFRDKEGLRLERPEWADDMERLMQ